MTELARWFASDLGHYFQKASAVELTRLVPRTYFSVGLDLGPGTVDCSKNFELGRSFRISPLIDEPFPSTVVGNWGELPLGKNSVDFILLQHTLDFADDPGQVLRESVQVLTTEGFIAILGFNPLGLWSLPRLLVKDQRKIPWSARFLSASRVQEWLNLLGTDLVAANYFFYRPPINSATVLGRLRVMESLGGRWWPNLSGGYLIIAQKRQVANRYVLREKRLSRRTVTRALHTTKDNHLGKSAIGSKLAAGPEANYL
jgi:SAM-dependent methyltransferase